MGRLISGKTNWFLTKKQNSTIAWPACTRYALAHESLTFIRWRIATAMGAKAPNFLVIFCEDLGYGDLGCFEHPTIAKTVTQHNANLKHGKNQFDRIIKK